MFFGCIVKENKPFIFNKTTNITHLSEASLSAKVDNSKVYVKIAVDDNEFNLCVLQKNRIESYKLDHFVCWSEHNKSYKLLISGGGPQAEVHFTGYIEMEDDEDNQDFVPGESLEIEEKQKKGKGKEKEEKDMELKEDNKEVRIGNDNENGNAGKALKAKDKKEKRVNEESEKNVNANANKKADNKGESSEKDLVDLVVVDSDEEEIENLLKKKRKNVESEKPNKPYEVKVSENKSNKINGSSHKNIKNQNKLKQK